MVASIKALHRMRQNYHEPLAEYRKRFVAAAEVLEHMDITLRKTFEGLSTKSFERQGQENEGHGDGGADQER